MPDPLRSEGIAFHFGSNEGRWELVKLPALDSFSFRHDLITLLNCQITLALGSNQGSV